MNQIKIGGPFYVVCRDCGDQLPTQFDAERDTLEVCACMTCVNRYIYDVRMEHLIGQLNTLKSLSEVLKTIRKARSENEG